jgi:cation diffusion facilitator CzcD-associated flavoprotein CzcO
MATAPLDHEVLVIGAGFSGIGAAIKLDEAGFSDYLVLEKDDGVGGAWHANTYPGVAVDIPPSPTRSRSSATRSGRGCTRPAPS